MEIKTAIWEGCDLNRAFPGGANGKKKKKKKAHLLMQEI